jgi:chromate transporter
MTAESVPPHMLDGRAPTGRWTEVLAAFLKLGLTSFGGPVAHLGFFREEFVHRRRWLDDRAYADLVALCQFLPGPASSKVGIAIGLSRAGYAGGLAAWLAFTFPSAAAMVAFAWLVGAIGTSGGAAWLHGLKVAAVAVVAQAVLGMMRSLVPDRERATIMVAVAALVLALPSAWTQVGAIVLGGAAGLLVYRGNVPADHAHLPLAVGKMTGLACLVAFFALLIGLPVLAAAVPSHTLDLIDAFYRAGSLVFGGGHVVLPLLQEAVVPRGWVSNDLFLAGYGAAQAVPGPLFTFAAYLGAIMSPAPNGVLGAVICIGAIFASSFLLVLGALPFWEEIRRRDSAQAALRGINAAVVGLLLAALYDPVWTSGIANGRDFAIASAAFLLLMMWRTPPWLVVILCAVAGGVLAAV